VLGTYLMSTHLLGQQHFMVGKMEREELEEIVINVGWEQILVDHHLTIEDVIIHLDDYGLVSLERYVEEIG
jgi:hypothetical protein